MKNDATIKLDQGGINARILAKEAKTDFRRVEAASRKIPTSFGSPEVKRLYVRFFNSMQLNTHFISVMARTNLPHETIEKIENGLQEQIDKFTAEVDKAIDGSEALFNANAITSVASYDAEPLALEVKVISKFGRRYLELMTKVDQLMPMLETLAIDEVIALRELEMRKSQFKKMIRQIAGSARNFKSGVQRRMNSPPDSITVLVDPRQLETLNEDSTAANGAGAMYDDKNSEALGNVEGKSSEKQAPRAHKMKVVVGDETPVNDAQ